MLWPSEIYDARQRLAIKRLAIKLAKPASKDTTGRGVMAAVPIPLDLAQRIAVRGGHLPEDMHVTLGYVGKLGEDGLPEDPDQVLDGMRKAVEPALRGHSKMEGQLSGTGTFTEGDDGVPAWAALDAPGLNELRTDVVRAMKKSDFPAREDHGFAPHVTVAYLKSGETHPLKVEKPLPAVLDRVVLKAGEKSIELLLGA